MTMGGGHHDDVKRVHNDASSSDDPGAETVRPYGTTDRDLRRIARSVKRALSLTGGESLLDVGCGTGRLAMSIIPDVETYVRVDYSSSCVAKFAARIDDAGFDWARVELGDPLADSLANFPQFDRVMAIASFHYAADEAEATRLLDALIDRSASCGLVLLGSLPLADLAASGPGRDSRRSAGEVLRWILVTDVKFLTRMWKLKVISFLAVRKMKRIISRTPVGDSYELSSECVKLTTELIKSLAATNERVVNVEFRAPCPFAPLAIGRADVVLELD